MRTSTFLSREFDAAVSRAATASGARLLQGVLVDLKVRTTLCSYLWIDRYGVLTIDYQEWPASTLKGTRKAQTWTAIPQGGKRAKFANPVAQADERKEMLDDALKACGRRLAPEYIQTLVIIGGANLDSLKLDDLTRARCLGLTEAEQHLGSRNDFPPNAGILEPEQVADLESLFRALDRSQDDEAVARHTAEFSVGGRTRSARKGQTSVQFGDSLSGRAPVASRISDRYPTTNVTAARRSALPVLLLILLVLLGVWVFVLGGGAMLAYQARGFMAGFGEPGTVEQPALQPITSESPDLQRAIDTLREHAPHVADTAVNLNSPTVTHNEGMVAYTWVYTQPGGSPAPRTMTLTFDSNGTLRGATGD